MKEKCIACGAEIDINKTDYYICKSIDVENGEPIFCNEICVCNYFGIEYIEEKQNDDPKRT